MESIPAPFSDEDRKRAAILKKKRIKDLEDEQMDLMREVKHLEREMDSKLNRIEKIDEELELLNN